MEFPHLYIEVTSRCNLSCNYCFIGNSKIVDLPSVENLLESFYQKGGKYITLSGGEPLLREDWFQIAKLSMELGITTTLFTNGILIKRNLANILDSNLKIVVSLDGIDESVNNSLRGIKSYSKIMRGIQLLIDEGKEEDMALSFTPTSINILQIEKIVEFSVLKGIKQLHISFLEERGNAKINKYLELSELEKITFMKKLYELSKKYEESLILEPSQRKDLIYDSLNFGKNILNFPLGKTLKFTAEGYVHTNPFVDGTLFLIGRYPQQDLDQILDSPKIQKLSDMIKKRPQKIEKCQNCIFNPVCCAGIYTLTYNKYGTIWVPDVYCQANQAIFETVFKDKVKR
jgi:radical SAM protein with 4Fe4S-binding SPASM domain